MTLKTEPHSQKELEEYLKELSPVTDHEASVLSWELCFILADLERRD